MPEAARVLLEAWLSSVQRDDSEQWRMPSSEGLRELLISTVDQLPGDIGSPAAGPKSTPLSPGSHTKDPGDAKSSKDAAPRAGSGIRSSQMEAARTRRDLDRDRATTADPETAPRPVSQTDAEAEAAAEALAEIPVQRSAAQRLVVGEPRREPVATIRLLGRYTIEGPGRSIVIGPPP